MTDTWEAPRARQLACLGWLSSLPDVVRKADWEFFSMKTACWFLCCRNPIKLSLGTLLMVPGGDDLRGMLATGFDKHPFQPEFLSELVGPVHLSAQLSLSHSQFSRGLSETLLSTRQRKLVCTHIFKWASCHSFLFFWMSQGFYYWENRAHARKSGRGFCGTPLHSQLVNAACLISLDAKEAEDFFSRNPCLFWFPNAPVPAARCFMPSHGASR